MLETGSGLILEITDGDGDYYRGNFAYDLVKTTVIRMAKAMAAEFDGQVAADQAGNTTDKPAVQITVAALTPGFLRSEEMLDHFGATELRKIPTLFSAKRRITLVVRLWLLLVIRTSRDLQVRHFQLLVSPKSMNSQISMV